jgi:hypothetical protein
MEKPPAASKELPLEKDTKHVQELKSLILSSEQYREHPFATDPGDHIYPYEISDGERTLTYFGTTHTNDPENPAFGEILKAFEKAHPEIVYVEGMEFINSQKDAVRERLVQESVEDAKKQGENYYTLKLAVDSGADFESPELKRTEEVNHLVESGFSKEDIFRFYFDRAVYGYQRQAKDLNKEDCLQYIGRNLKAFRDTSDLLKEEVDALEHEAIANLDIHDEDKYQSAVDPIPWENKESTVTNDISRRLSFLRDEYQFERIAEGLQTHSHIFVVYGSAHAVKQEPALRELLKKKEINNSV